MNWEGVRERKCGGESSKRENQREAEGGEISHQEMVLLGLRGGEEEREIAAKNFGRGRSILHSCIEEGWL